MSSVVSCLLPAARVDRAALGLLGAAERVAGQIGQPHVCVVLCSADDADLTTIAAHCDEVVHATVDEILPEQWLAVLHAVCTDSSPRMVLLANDTYSQELAPRLAHRLSGGCVSDVQSIECTDGRLRVTRAVYGGKAQAVYEFSDQPAVAWIRARAFAPESPRTTAAQIRELSPPTDGTNSLRIVERQTEAAGEERLEEAQVIVSGGRGLGGPEPFDELQTLANVMGGQLGASRAACDAGWISHNHQVGQTGKKVAPELYLAVAISGASQHLMGIADAKVVAAINTDRDAPIFKHCQFGLVEDYRNVIGPLQQRLKESL